VCKPDQRTKKHCQRKIGRYRSQLRGMQSPPVHRAVRTKEEPNCGGFNCDSMHVRVMPYSLVANRTRRFSFPRADLADAVDCNNGFERLPSDFTKTYRSLSKINLYTEGASITQCLILVASIKLSEHHKIYSNTPGSFS
jgi:hypothetical protein